jgi:hypothetical protein
MCKYLSSIYVSGWQCSSTHIPNIHEPGPDFADYPMNTVPDKVKQLVEDTKCESYFEWPKKNDGWRQPRVEELMKSTPHFTSFDGCAYGLKNADGNSMRKTWQVASTHPRMKDYLNKTCTCKEEHAQVRGKDGKATEEYTKDMVEVIVQCLINQKISLKPVRKQMTKEELELHQRHGHDPRR